MNVCHRCVHLYLACYNRASERGNDAVAFAWNVAGPWLCYIKARRQLHRQRPGCAPRLLDPSVLTLLMSNARRRAGATAEDEPGGGAEGDAEPHGAHDDRGDDDISTPWTRAG